MYNFFRQLHLLFEIASGKLHGKKLNENITDVKSLVSEANEEIEEYLSRKI